MTLTTPRRSTPTPHARPTSKPTTRSSPRASTTKKTVASSSSCNGFTKKISPATYLKRGLDAREPRRYLRRTKDNSLPDLRQDNDPPGGRTPSPRARESSGHGGAQKGSRRLRLRCADPAEAHTEKRAPHQPRSFQTIQGFAGEDALRDPVMGHEFQRHVEVGLCLRASVGSEGLGLLFIPSLCAGPTGL